MNTPKIVTLIEKKFVGLSITTTNEAEMTSTGKIGPLWERFWKDQVLQEIQHQEEPRAIIALYSQYASDELGSYQYSIGCFVEKVEHLHSSESLQATSLSPTTYAVFTTRKGPLKEVVVETWQEIWEWSQETQRTFLADFELYDERSSDPMNAEVDIYIGIKS